MPQKPIVAIIGQPNVGKSTLFNRIVRRRMAVVDDTPGITRDRNYAAAEWSGRDFLLVDTGGFIPDAENGIEAAVKRQAEVAMEEANLILFLVDVEVGITGLDAEIARILRRGNKECLVVVNKVDNAFRENLVSEFLRLGLGDPIPVSALSGRNMGDLLDELISHLPDGEPGGEETEEGYIKVAVVGRPNVGKSSFVNAIVGEEKVIVHEAPGTTRDAIDTRFEHGGRKFLLIDTAGLRRKSRVSSAVEYYCSLRALRSIERCDVALILTDAMEGITHQDIRIFNQAHEVGKGMVLVVNKWDLVEQKVDRVWEHEREFEEEIKRRLPFLGFVPIVFASALTGFRVMETLEIAVRIKEERTRRVKTSELNRFLEQLKLSHPPPIVRGKQAKLYYCTQHAVEPPTFVFFCNDPKQIGENYQRFLEKRIRENFGFYGTPIRLLFRERRKTKKEEEYGDLVVGSGGQLSGRFHTHRYHRRKTPGGD